LKSPLTAGSPLQPEDWKSVRMQAMFDCCKWDVQSEDHSVLADFPLFLEREEWASLAGLAEKLAEEVLAAERELFSKAKLHLKLGLPGSVRSVLRKCRAGNSPAGSARLMRFDFHFTPEGWRISEVNADVPGGLIEASGFTELMAAYYPGYLPPPNPVTAYGEAIAQAAGEGATIGLVYATAHYDDRQVMQYLAQSLQRRGLQIVVLSPAHLTWEYGCAHVMSSFAKTKPVFLVRFFPAEWLPNLRPSSSWTPWFCGGQTPMSNPASAILIQSKRFPLVWNELDTPLSTWRSLLPRTSAPARYSPHSAPTGSSSRFLAEWEKTWPSPALPNNVRTWRSSKRHIATRPVGWHKDVLKQCRSKPTMGSVMRVPGSLLWTGGRWVFMDASLRNR
jgi:glutathionylspermidine synthase